MKKYLNLSGIGSIICLAIAGVLAFKQIEGWGWFLFVGLLISGAITFGNSKEESEDDEENQSQ